MKIEVRTDEERELIVEGLRDLAKDGRMITLDTTNLESWQLLGVEDALRRGRLASDPMAGHALNAVRGELSLRAYLASAHGRPSGAREPFDAKVLDLWRRRHVLTNEEWLEAAPVLLGLVIGNRTSQQ